jgi:hypothetical protein
MRTTKTLLLLAVGLGMAGSASAALIASTSFGGTAAAPTGNTGFSSSIWASTAGGATASSATFTAGDMSGTIPSAYTASGFTNTGNYIQTYNSPAFATLSSTINVETEGTYYFSFLYRVNAAATVSNGGFSLYSGTTERVQIGMGSTVSNPNAMRISEVGGSAGVALTASSSFVTGTDTIWVVGRIDTAIGTDSVALRFFKGADAMVAEDFTGDQSTSLSLSIGANITNIRFNSGGGTNPTQQFDEFRLGTTYADVVPEPSTYAMFAGLMALGLVMIRRRLRS